LEIIFSFIPVNEQVDNAEYEFLWKLLANPADPNHSYIFNLQSLVTDYPQSGALRALLMPNGDKRHLKHAAAYFNPMVLHKLATAPDSLPVVTSEQVVYSDEPPAVPADAYFNIPVAEPFVPPTDEPEISYSPVTDDNAVEDHQTDTPYNRFAEHETTADNQQNDLANAYNTFAENEKDLNNYPGHWAKEAEPLAQPIAETYSQEIPAYIEDDGPAPYTYPVPENAVDHADNAYTQPEVIAETAPIQENYIYEAIATPLAEELAPAGVEETTAISAVKEENTLEQEFNAHLADSYTEPTEPVSSYDDVRYFHQDIDDEVYDEIVSIEDIGLEQLAILNKSANEDAVIAAPAANENHFVFELTIAKSNDEEPQYSTPTERKPFILEQTTNDQANNDVSRYNDEKMPYSFMWWLDKTRKEHADIYQPYISNSASAPSAKPKNKEVVDELQQQYYQNIVSTSSIDELDQTPQKAVSNSSPKKGDKIIERFIQEEPQIKHPSGIKLNNENKAKRSSEDKEELVTETLARIYTEQMLYHKAILTYKKLMLKFPEKSLYFAGQIEQLESKIN
jgi:hypothetical protein